MSIVTDALNRLQSERSPKIAATSSESRSPVSSVFSPTRHKPVASSPPIIRQVLQGLALVMLLGVIGLGAYLWGLTMVPTVPEVSSPPYADSMDVTPSSSTETEREIGQAEVALASKSSLSDAVTASPESGPMEGQSVPGNREKGVKTSTVSRLAKTALGTKRAPVGLQTVNAPRERQSIAPPPRSSPGGKPGDEKTVTPEAKTGPAKVLTKNKVSSGPSPLVPSGRTVLERRLSLVKQLINRKRYGQAMTLLQPLFVDPPGKWEPWFWRGTAHLGLGQLGEAEESFVEGLARDSTIPHLWVQRALVSQQRGHFGEAVESLRQAELLAPELPEVQLNLGYSLEVRGDARLAVEHYQTFLSLTEGTHGYQSARKKVFNRILQIKNS